MSRKLRVIEQILEHVPAYAERLAVRARRNGCMIGDLLQSVSLGLRQTRRQRARRPRRAGAPGEDQQHGHQGETPLLSTWGA